MVTMHVTNGSADSGAGALTRLQATAAATALALLGAIVAAPLYAVLGESIAFYLQPAYRSLLDPGLVAGLGAGVALPPAAVAGAWRLGGRRGAGPAGAALAAGKATLGVAVAMWVAALVLGIWATAR
jgi:hypothetical protein